METRRTGGRPGVRGECPAHLKQRKEYVEEKEIQTKVSQTIESEGKKKRTDET